MGAAGFKGDIESGAPAPVPVVLSVTESFYFSVRFPGTVVPATPNDFAAFNQDSPNHRVGRGGPVAAASEPQSEPHEFRVQSLSPKFKVIFLKFKAQRAEVLPFSRRATRV